MENNKFYDRKGSNLNKKILEVENVERNESGEVVRLYVEEVRNDSEGLVEEGTPLNAEQLNLIVNNIIKSRLANLEDERIYIVNEDYNNINVSSEVENNFVLPTTGANGSIITWESNNEAIAINESDALVTRGDDDITVTLKASIKYGGYSNTKEFNVTVIKRELTAREKVELDKDSLLLSSYEVEDDFTLPTEGANGSTITWQSNDSHISIVGSSALVSRDNVDVDVELTATITYGLASATKTFIVKVLLEETGINPVQPNISYEIDTQYVQWESNKQGALEGTITITANSNIYVKVINSYQSNFNMTVSNNGSSIVAIHVVEVVRPDLSMQSFYDFTVKIYNGDREFVNEEVCSLCYN